MSDTGFRNAPSHKAPIHDLPEPARESEFIEMLYRLERLEANEQANDTLLDQTNESLISLATERDGLLERLLETTEERDALLAAIDRVKAAIALCHAPPEVLDGGSEG